MSRREFLGTAAGAGLGAATTAGMLAAEYAGGISHGKERGHGIVKEQKRVAVGDKHIRWMGVTHSLGTFRAHEEELRAQIQESGLVALEYFNEALGNDALPGTDDTTLEKETFSAQGFFGAVGRMCAEEGKDIVVVNPDSVAAEAFQVFLLLGLPAGVATKAVASLDNRSFTSRRAFVTGMLALPAVAAWANEFGATDALLRTGTHEKTHPSVYEIGDLGTLGIQNVMDWRDVVTAEGLTMATHKYAEDLSSTNDLLAYHGLDHSGTIGYLEDPELRREKEKLYTLRNAFGPTSLRRYHFDKEQKAWQLVDNSPLQEES